MTANPLRRLEQFGQSIWRDYIRQHMIITGELHRLVEEEDLRGVMCKFFLDRLLMSLGEKFEGRILVGYFFHKEIKNSWLFP